MKPSWKRLPGVVLAALWLGSTLAVATELRIDPPELRIGGLGKVFVASPEVSGHFGDRELKFFALPGGSLALVAADLDDDVGTRSLRLETPAGELRREVVIRPVDYPEERLQVARKYVDLDEKTLARVTRESARLKAIWEAPPGPKLWEGPFAKPAKGKRGSPFGLRRFFNDEPRSPHAGIDYRAGRGTPVYASGRGRVALADHLYFAGRIVVLDHGAGLFTLYLHLSEMDVREGQLLEQGALVGKVGDSGRVTGPHLHFAVRLGTARVDPTDLIGHDPGGRP